MDTHLIHIYLISLFSRLSRDSLHIEFWTRLLAGWKQTGQQDEIKGRGVEEWMAGGGEECLEPAALPCGDVTTSRASQGPASCQTCRDTQLSHLVSMGDETVGHIQMGGGAR